MRRHTRFIVAGVAITALATAVLCSVTIRESFLVLTNDNSGEVLLMARLGEEFSVSFIHSVNISPVTEIFQIQDGQIVLAALEFETFGAGMPTALEPGQELIRLPDGGMRIEGFDRVINSLRFIIGHTTEHTLHIGERHIPLKSLDAPGQPVLFEVIRFNIWQRPR